MEFAPPTRRAKPITKAELRRLQANYAESSQYTETHKQEEDEERKKIDAEFDDQIDQLL